MFLLYSVGFNADLLSEYNCVYGTSDNCAETYACLAANIILLRERMSAI
jgi:hypothetical protein